MFKKADHSIDPIIESGDPAAARAVTALDRAYAVTPPSTLREAMDRAVYAAMAMPRASSALATRRWNARVIAPRRRLAALALALLLALGGTAGVVGLGGLAGPTPVSAQTILRRAATAGLAPNQITHFVYQVNASTGFSGVSEFWVQADAAGAPERIAFAGTAPDPNVAILRHLAGAYEMYVGNNPAAPAAASQMMGQQTLDGHTVDVVKDPMDVLLYFDAQSYILLGADLAPQQDGTPATSSGSDRPTSWSARLLQAGTVPASAVPAASWHIHANSPASGATPSGSQ